MTYEEYVIDVFIEHHTAQIGGYSEEECRDIIEEVGIAAVERWLIRQGYDLSRN